MTLQEIRQEMMASENIIELYNIELDLVERIGILHKEVIMADSPMSQSEIKANLSMANALLNICKERQAEMKDLGGRLNYNFRMAAKAILTKENYKNVMDFAVQPRHEVKSELSKLKHNRK